MSAGTGIEVRTEPETWTPVRVGVSSESELEARYKRLLALVMRMGTWLTGPHARLLGPEDWDAHFARYQDHLEQLRRLGDELRPQSLRDRGEALAGDALVGEVLELFAA